MGLIVGLTSQQAVNLDLEVESTVRNLATCHPSLGVFHKQALSIFKSEDPDSGVAVRSKLLGTKTNARASQESGWQVG